MTKAFVFVFVAAGAVALAAQDKFGEGVQVDQPTPIADIVKNPEAYIGMTLRVDGVATAICQHMGCWMAVSESDKPGAPTVRLKVDDGVIVFPVTAKGKAVSAQGKFERIEADDLEGKEAASEYAKQQTRPDAATAQYQLKATGAIVK